MLKTSNIASQLGESQLHGLQQGRLSSSREKGQESDAKIAREDSIELSQEGIVRLRRMQSAEIAAQNLVAAGSTFAGFQSAQELLNNFEVELG